MVEAGERVKVTDFGIARVTDSGENLTQTGGLLGTPSYMSPEQAKGTEGRRPQRPVLGGLRALRAARRPTRPSPATPSPGSCSRSSPRSPRRFGSWTPSFPTRSSASSRRPSPSSPTRATRPAGSSPRTSWPWPNPAHVPTLRQTDVPTAHGVAPGATPTIATPPTAQGHDLLGTHRRPGSGGRDRRRSRRGAAVGPDPAHRGLRHRAATPPTPSAAGHPAPHARPAPPERAPALGRAARVGSSPSGARRRSCSSPVRSGTWMCSVAGRRRPAADDALPRRRRSWSRLRARRARGADSPRQRSGA